MDKIKNIIRTKLKEMNATGQGGTSFTSGEGMNHTTPKVFSKKKIHEGELNDFQKERIDAFTDIETRLNALAPLVSNAKNDTVEFYNNNPGSYEIYKSTEMILSYLKNIETLLTQTK